MQHADDLRCSCSARKDQLLLDDDLSPERHSEEHSKECDSEAPQDELCGGEDDGESAIETLGELSKGWDNADESGAEG